MESIKCPKCKKEIEYANFSALVENYGDVELPSGNHNTRDYGDWQNIIYSCPECDKEITEAVGKVL